jgi:hypothetical protein
LIQMIHPGSSWTDRLNTGCGSGIPEMRFIGFFSDQAC